jgi:hypothetical protein
VIGEVSQQNPYEKERRDASEIAQCGELYVRDYGPKPNAHDPNGRSSDASPGPGFEREQLA